MLALTFGSPIEDSYEKESIVTKKVTGNQAGSLIEKDQQSYKTEW